MAHRLLVAEPENPAGVRAARVDPALNGLQVGRTGATVTRFAFAVDACQETLQRAADWDADLLFVHHGLFWGRPLALTGTRLELYGTDGAQGAARAAGLGAGLYRDAAEALGGQHQLRTVEPDPGALPAYREAYERWCSVFEL